MDRILEWNILIYLQTHATEESGPAAKEQAHILTGMVFLLALFL